MFGFLKHLFIPHEKNNHRAKILHNTSIFIVLVLIIFSSLSIYLVKTARPDILGISYSISESELLALVNQKRQEIGLAPLELNSALSDASRRKAADMLAKNYWAHFAPDGLTSPWEFIRAAGYSYVHAGENLAKGFTDSASTVNAWMDSQSHRDNILSGKYKDVGFAIVPGTLQGEETVLIVEMFGSQQTPALAAVAPAETVAIQEEKIPQVNVALETIEGEKKISESEPKNEPKQEENKVVVNPKIDVGLTTRAISTVGLSFFAFAFMMDFVIIERKKIPRIVGHNIDHIMLILAFLLFLILQRVGVII